EDDALGHVAGEGDRRPAPLAALAAGLDRLEEDADLDGGAVLGLVDGDVLIGDLVSLAVEEAAALELNQAEEQGIVLEVPAAGGAVLVDVAAVDRLDVGALALAQLVAAPA